MAVARLQPKTVSRDYNEVVKYNGLFADITYAASVGSDAYEVIHRANMIVGNVAVNLEPTDICLVVKNKSKDSALTLHLQTIYNDSLLNPEFDVTIHPEMVVVYVNLLTTVVPTLVSNTTENVHSEVIMIRDPGYRID